MGITVSEYVSGGYYVTRLSRHAEYMSPELIPDKVISASGCICEFFPDDWAIEWTSESVDDRSRQAAALGISTIDLPKVVTWATESFSKAFGWPSAFYTLEAAQEARARFLSDDSEIVIFGLGLHDSDVEDFLRAAKPEPTKPGCAPVGETGAFQCVSGGKKIAAGGDAVGFELLATYTGLLTCSWLCNGLEKDCANELGIVTNRHGFVQTYADALRCAEFISRDETGAEPGLWLPWLVTVYSTQSVE
ncbi:MAG TPA: hypothetical protein VLE22_04780 [Bryobacteraceae bacterium]|nr:hypothetical protein [Bryobacteraceae bacterium]